MRTTLQDERTLAALGSSEKNRTARVFLVLRAISEAFLPVTISQLGLLTRIPKATLSRLVTELIKEGYVLPLPGRRTLVPGPSAIRLGLGVLGNGQFRRECRAVLHNVVGRLGENCNLTIRDGECVSYVERVGTNEMLRLHLEPGTRAPLHCTAGGKLFLANLEQDEQSRLLRIMPLKRMTPATITDPEVLKQELQRLKKLGIGIDNEEFVVGMIGLAIPVRAANGTILAAFVCHAAAARTPLTALERHIPLLEASAKALADLFMRG
ncbi:MAG: IclR family transcriptional regulator [Paralcaligenes sp.]